MRGKQRIEEAAQRAGMTGRVFRGRASGRFGWFIQPLGRRAEYLGRGIQGAIQRLDFLAIYVQKDPVSEVGDEEGPDETMETENSEKPTEETTDAISLDNQ